MVQVNLARWISLGMGISTFLCMILLGRIVLGQSSEHLIPAVEGQNTGYFQPKAKLISQPSLRLQDSSRRFSQATRAPVNQRSGPFVSDEVTLALGTSEPRGSGLVRVEFLQQDQDLDRSDQEDDDLEELNKKDDEETTEDNEDREPRSVEMSQTWIRKPIQSVRTDIREREFVAPEDRSSELDYGLGDWNQFQAVPKVFAWYAPDIRYQPLFFEDVALERYGQTMGFHRQTIRSGCHFFKSVMTFPNKMRHDSPWSCDYPLGFCRPGNCVQGIEQKHYLGRPY